MMGMSSNQIEELKVKYFEYMTGLNRNIRLLKKKIKSETEILNSLLNDEKEYIDIITSINTGRGYYHDISMLPYDMKIAIDNGKKYTDEQLENLKHNYELAVEAEKKIQERYEFLRSNAVERNMSIKEHRKSITNNKRKLTRRQKEYDSNFAKVKKLDKQLEK